MKTEDLSQLAELMAERAIEYAEIESNGSRYRLHVESNGPEGEASTLAVPSETYVSSKHPGLFLYAHPERPNEKIEAGARVEKGQFVGYLQAGLLLLRVASEHTAVVTGFLVEDQAIVGYGSPVMKLQIYSRSPQHGSNASFSSILYPK